MGSKVVKRYSLSRQVADRLEGMIADGEYKIGDRIPTETELMEIFSVSRNTLREAIQSLTSAGILDVKQGDGTYVRATNRFDANMSRELENVSLTDITETRNALEITIAKLASKRRTDEDMAVIESKLIQRQGLKETVKENTVADMHFHMAIADACHNKILTDLYKSISAYLENHISERQAETELNPAQIDYLHEKLFQAIKNQEPDVADVCARNILKI